MASLVSDKRKEVINNIHKSDIFFTQTTDSQPVKIRENLKSQICFDLQDGPSKNKSDSTKSSFQPKFKDANAFNRRVKEFYGNVDEESIPQSSMGHIAQGKVLNNTFKREDFSSLTVKEKKILEICPQMTKDEVKVHLQRIEMQKEQDQASKFNEIEHKKGENSKQTYFNQQDSNIFNLKKKKNYSISNKADLEETVKKEPKTVKNGKRIISDESAWSSKLNWKEIDSMTYFHKKDRNLSPQQLKQDNLKSNFSIQHDQKKLQHTKNNEIAKDDDFTYNNIDADANMNSNIRSQIDQELKIKFNGMPTTKYMKSLDLSSSLHGPDFYSKNLNGNILF